MVDGSASKSALRQDTGYVVEKTYHDIAPYLELLGPILCLSDPYMVQNVFPYTKTMVGTWQSTHVIFHLFKKPLVLVQTTPTDYMVEKTYNLARYFGLFGAYLIPQGPK